MDGFNIKDISEMPIGEGLETHLHPKRMRVWQPSESQTAFIQAPVASNNDEKTASAAPPQSLASAMLTAPATFVECDQSAPSTPSGSPTMARPETQTPELVMPLSLSMFVEYGQSAPSTSSGLLKGEDDIVFGLNFGSDGSSDENDDEVVSPFIPRVFRSMLETPMDDDVAEDVTNYVHTPAITSRSAAVVDVSSASMHRPTSFYEFEWKTFPDPPISAESRREIFSESNGPTIPHVDPYDIFVVIWDRQFMEYIASETNRYAQQVAQQMMDNNNLQPNSRISRWYDTTADELYIYYGIIIAMGVVVKSRLGEYWNATADIFCTPGFGAYMPINRFILLNKFLHFVNNQDMRASELGVTEAKLFKIMPVLSHLNHKFQSMYKLAQNIALDESLLQWKGWLDNDQSVPNKAVMGIKSYEICESQTGYLWRFEIHAHKRSTQQQPEEPLNSSTPSIVLRLSHGLENKGHTLWMDNFYNSPSLARRLKSWGIDCAGTLRTNRQFVPQDLHKLTKANMHRGQITGLSSGDVDVMVWRDNNRVAMISTYHGNAVKKVRESTKPNLILDYNIMKGGVDKKDQLLAMYPIERKQARVWYKQLFRRLLNVSVLNSFIIHHHHSSSLTHRNFRIALVKSLLSKHSSTTPLISLPSAVTTQNGPADITHRLAEYPLQNSYRKRRVCKVCKKRVHTFCVGCNKSVCLDTCFLLLHT